MSTQPIPQHMAALTTANRVRLARAKLKHQIADGERAVADIIEQRPWEAETMPIANLMMAQHRWGRTRTLRFLNTIPMAETKTLGSMTARQRRNLVARLRGEVVVDPLYDPLRMAG